MAAGVEGRVTANVSDWLRDETQAHLSLLTKLRQKLETSLPTDVNERGTPSKDWCRGLARYQTGWQAMLTEERERWKLRLLSQRAGLEVLDDAEFERGLKELQAEARHQMTVEELEAELAMRRQAVLALAAGDPDARADRG